MQELMNGRIGSDCDSNLGWWTDVPYRVCVEGDGGVSKVQGDVVGISDFGIVHWRFGILVVETSTENVCPQSW